MDEKIELFNEIIKKYYDYIDIKDEIKSLLLTIEGKEIDIKEISIFKECRGLF